MEMGDGGFVCEKGNYLSHLFYFYNFLIYVGFFLFTFFFFFFFFLLFFQSVVN